MNTQLGKQGRDSTRKPAHAATGAAGRDPWAGRFQQAAFATAAGQPGSLPPDGGCEIAFAGRSNSGKSTAINALANRKRLAFASKTPGRTQQINFFSLPPDGTLVDLPGYGYAKVPQPLRRLWGELIGEYLERRASLAGLVLIMDARHPLTDLDRELLDWIRPRGLPVLALLTKADRLARSRAREVLRAVRTELEMLAPGSMSMLFSGKTREGAPEARAVIAAWLGWTKEKPPVKGE